MDTAELMMKAGRMEELANLLECVVNTAELRFLLDSRFTRLGPAEEGTLWWTFNDRKVASYHTVSLADCPSAWNADDGVEFHFYVSAVEAARALAKLVRGQQTPARAPASGARPDVNVSVASAVRFIGKMAAGLPESDRPKFFDRLLAAVRGMEESD